MNEHGLAAVLQLKPIGVSISMTGDHSAVRPALITWPVLTDNRASVAELSLVARGDTTSAYRMRGWRHSAVDQSALRAVGRCPSFKRQPWAML